MKRVARPFAGPIWIAPAFALIVALLLYPVGRAVALSLTDRSAYSAGEFVGLANFDLLLRDELFWRALRNNLILLISVPVSILVALAATGILYRGMRGSRAYETAIFLPFLPAVASISAIFIYLLANDGPLNAGLRTVGLEGLAQGWLTDADLAIWSILGVVIWKRIGFTILLLTARMSSLDRSLFEAAAVDGASWLRTYWRIAVPQMRSMIQFAAILGFIEVFSFTFAYVFVLTRGGPSKASYTLEFYLYDTQFRAQLVGLAAAVAVILLAFAALAAVYRVAAARRDGAL